MTKGDPADNDRLVDEMCELPAYKGWYFSYEYPGFFCYSHPDLPYRVAFTPDWQGDEELPIEVSDDDGNFYEEHSPVFPLPREGRTAEKIFAIVRPTLDKLASLPPTKATKASDLTELRVSLTAEEIAALPAALDHVRKEMAHQHPWKVRDAAVAGIGKLVEAAAKARES